MTHHSTSKVASRAKDDLRRLQYIKKVKLVAKKDYPELEKIHTLFDVVEENAEICISVGGDGTLLKAVNEFDGPVLPIGGQSEKSLGFYADFRIQEMDIALEQLLQGYVIEKHRKIGFEFKGKKHYALNEVRIFRGDCPSSIHFGLYVRNKNQLERFYPRDVKADGLIFATPVGSTAYNFNVYGPIIHKGDVMVISPISARVPPIVTNDKFFIEITKNNGYLEYDHLVHYRIQEGDGLSVALSDKYAKIIRLKEREPFYHKLERLSRFVMF
ncbi:MAG: NAD(+)/NADH kinase [Promethearchaeota archaeon]